MSEPSRNGPPREQPARERRGQRLLDRDLRARVHRRLVARAPTGDDDAVHTELADLLRSEAPLLTQHDFAALLRALHDEVRGLGLLEPMLEAPDVCEVMVNGPGQVYVERAGRIERVELDIDAEEIVRIVERVVAPLGLRFDRSAPIVDARLGDGSRLHAVLPPLAVDGPCVTIRRFSAHPMGLASFGCDDATASFLRWAVLAGWNVLIAGGTSTGKTTLAGALTAMVPDRERLVTIEETAELVLRVPHVVRLEARRANAEGVGKVTVRELVRTALRMRPDRLVVGEVRGAEALDLLQALNTGHDGSFSTVHANRPDDALRRLETLALFAGDLPLTAVRSQIASALDAVVQVGRGDDGKRLVTEVAEVAGDAHSTRALFHRRSSHGAHVDSSSVLRPVEAPTRAPRRYGTAPPDPGWFEC